MKIIQINNPELGSKVTCYGQSSRISMKGWLSGLSEGDYVDILKVEEGGKFEMKPGDIIIRKRG